MRKRPAAPPQPSPTPPSKSETQQTSASGGARGGRAAARRSGSVWMLMMGVLMYASYGVYHYQYENLPAPLTADQAGKRGFSEVEALKHVEALTRLGPHPVGSDALDLALQYVLEESERIKKTAHWEVDVEIDFFHAKSGANRMVSGLFKGKTLVYSDLNHIVLRIMPKYTSQAEENAILISSHIDTVFSTEGAGDCSSCIAVMLELARGISQWAHGFKHSVIFLLNTGEEEGLNGAHSFITQHPWSKSIRMAIDLEAMGVGGKSSIFQAPYHWAIEKFASSAKYPSGNVIAQDLFSSGAIKSATDFQVYKEVANLSGLDFAFTANGAVYHTKNDKQKLLRSGSLQHLGENMLAYLLQVASSSQFPKAMAMEEGEESGQKSAVFFDILGTYMIVYKQSFASTLHNAVIMQSLLIWVTSLLMGGSPAAMSLVLSCLSVLLMLIFSISFSILVAFILPLISSSAIPFVANPWLVVGLFAAPALLGALTGQHVGYLVLQMHLSKVYSKKDLSSIVRVDLVKLESERWLFKAGFLQWFVLLIVGNYYKIGSSYMALFWLVPPAFAYGLLEATLTPARFPRPLKLATLLIGLAVPVLISAGSIIQLTTVLIGMVVRFDRNPGSSPDWLGNAIIAVFIAVIISLTLVYILSYVHLSGDKRSIILVCILSFGLSLFLVFSGISPAFSEDIARAVNVVHVVDSTGRSSGKQEPISFVSLFSTTPGKLTQEVEQIGEGFVCGRDKIVDLVSFFVKYGCWTFDDSESGWSEPDIPTLQVDSDTKGPERITRILIDTKAATRWSLAINTHEVEDFILKVAEDPEELIPYGDKSSIDGWHTIQFSGGKQSPKNFKLTLFWSKSPMSSANKNLEDRPLVKLRTDVDHVTPKAKKVLEKLPAWCSLFGKSTSPHMLAFLTSLPVNLV